MSSNTSYLLNECPPPDIETISISTSCKKNSINNVETEYKDTIEQIISLAISIENQKNIDSSLSKEIAFYCFLKNISDMLNFNLSIDYFEKIIVDFEYSFVFKLEDFQNRVDYLEILYSNVIPNSKKRSYGQYFTPPHIAELMTKLGMLSNPHSILDPAGGGSIFLSFIESKEEINCKIIDRDPLCIMMTKLNLSRKISHLNFEYENCNFLNFKDKNKYDLIIANPPYIRFQDFSEKDETIKLIENEAGIKLSKLINYYALFFFHSISMLKENGKLVFITPTEYLNFNYGSSLKKFITKFCDIESIILFDSKSLVFEENLSSACITILTRKQNPDKNKLVKFVKILKWKSVDEIFDIVVKDAVPTGSSVSVLTYPQNKLNYKEKWNNYFEVNEKYEAIKHNLVELSKYANVSRGIATGANKYFVLSKSKVEQLGIENIFLKPVIEKSLNCKHMDFTDEDFETIEKTHKPAYLLYVLSAPSENLLKYIKQGENEKINETYLPSKRNPWYSMEKRDVAKIWAGTFSRGGCQIRP